MVPCEAFWHMDTTNCNMSKIGSKIIAIRFCETWNRILKACIALKPEVDEKWKPRNFINSDQLCLTSTRHFWKMYRKWKIPNFQIYGFYDFFLFKSLKSTKNPQNSILCTLWNNLYTKHRERQQLFEFAYKLKYYALLFFLDSIWYCSISDDLSCSLFIWHTIFQLNCLNLLGWSYPAT